MPDSLHPTYVQTALPPRLLNRWLDVNSQNGPLQRTRGFFLIPAFDIEVDWEGFSDIVGEYNYVASANFSLQYPVNVPLAPNYVLTIMYVNSDNTVVRYLIAGNPLDGVFYSPLVPYTGQLIKQNFKIEIWSIEDSDATQTRDISILSTLLGNLDYRYGTDFALANPSALCTSVKSAPGSFPTEPNLLSLNIWLSSDAGVTITGGKVSSWVDRIAGLQFNQATAGIRPTLEDDISFGKLLKFVGNNRLATGATCPVCRTLWFAVVQSIGALTNHIIYEVDNPTAIKLINDNGTQDGAVCQFDGNFLQANPNPSSLTVFKVDTLLESVTVYDLLSGISKGTTTTGIVGVDEAPTSITLGDQFVGASSNGIAILAFLAYEGISSSEQDAVTINYLLGLVPQNNNLAIPLTFAQCAQPVLNP